MRRGAWITWAVMGVGWPGGVGCASSPPPATPPVAPSSSSAEPGGEGPIPADSAATTAPASPPSATPPGPPPTGGSVLIGDINAPREFDPKAALSDLKPKLLDCFNQARATHPALHGKLTVRIVVNEAGQGLSAEADPGGSAYDPGLVQCIDAAVKDGPKFPKPGGTATIAVPLVFRR